MSGDEKQGERSRSRSPRRDPKYKDEGQVANREVDGQRLALPAHLLNANDCEKFNISTREFFGDKGDSDLKISSFNQVFARVNKEIASTAEVITCLGLKPSKETPSFLRNAKVLDYAGGLTMSNKTIEEVSSNLENYYVFPGKVYEFLYINAESIVSNVFPKFSTS